MINYRYHYKLHFVSYFKHTTQTTLGTISSCIFTTQAPFPPEPCKEQSWGWRTRMLCRMYSCQGGTTLIRTTGPLTWRSLLLSHWQQGSVQSSVSSSVCVAVCLVAPSAAESYMNSQRPCRMKSDITTETFTPQAFRSAGGKYVTISWLQSNTLLPWTCFSYSYSQQCIWCATSMDTAQHTIWFKRH